MLCLLLYFVVFFFFFQAEDGIRDTSVTGVQTCALPISNYITEKLRRAALDWGKAVSSRSGCLLLTPGSRKNPQALALEIRLRVEPRSEERRVGKECRSRGAPYHENKKRQTNDNEEDNKR